MLFRSLVWSTRKLINLLSPQTRLKRFLVPALTLIAILLISGNLLFYFGEYRNSNRFGDRNSEVAYGIAIYLQSLEEPHTAYLYGPPAVYIDFPTIPFLAERFEPNINLFNVLEPDAPLEETRFPDSNLVFLFLPERASELEEVRAQYPDGKFLAFEGLDRKSTRLNYSHSQQSRMPSSA